MLLAQKPQVSSHCPMPSRSSSNDATSSSQQVLQMRSHRPILHMGKQRARTRATCLLQSWVARSKAEAEASVSPVNHPAELPGLRLSEEIINLRYQLVTRYRANLSPAPSITRKKDRVLCGVTSARDLGFHSQMLCSLPASSSCFSMLRCPLGRDTGILSSMLR